MKKVVYLDNNATTQCVPAVVEEMLPYFTEKYGNPSSMHTFGGENRHVIDQARHTVADFINAAYDDEIIFTSCASESDNTAIFSAVSPAPKRRRLSVWSIICCSMCCCLQPFSFHAGSLGSTRRQ